MLNQWFVPFLPRVPVIKIITGTLFLLIQSTRWLFNDDYLLPDERAVYNLLSLRSLLLLADMVWKNFWAGSEIVLGIQEICR